MQTRPADAGPGSSFDLFAVDLGEESKVDVVRAFGYVAIGMGMWLRRSSLGSEMRPGRTLNAKSTVFCLRV